MPQARYSLEPAPTHDLSGRCGHCKAEEPLKAFMLSGASGAARFFLGLSSGSPLLRCEGCRKLSQRLTPSGKLMVGLSWAPIALAFGAAAIYFGVMSGDSEGARGAGVALAALSGLGSFIVGFMLWRVLGTPLYPVAGTVIEQEGKTFWAR